MRLIIFFSLTLLTQLCYAAKIDQVKGDKILISFTTENVAIGDSIYALQETVDSKTTEDESFALITQVRNKQAVAKIQIGKFNVGQNITIQRTSKSKKNLQVENVIYRYDLFKISVLGKILANTISTKQADDSQPYPQTETVDMSGINFGLATVAEYPAPWLKLLTLRGILSYDPVLVKGSALNNSCDAKKSKDCNVNIHYLSFGAQARYDFFKTKSVFWGALGGTMKIPISKSSSALQEDDIRLANSIVISLGVDFIVNNKIFYPMSFEYHSSLNKSDTVPTINQITFQGGYGWQF